MEENRVQQVCRSCSKTTSILQNIIGGKIPNLMEDIVMFVRNVLVSELMKEKGSNASPFDLKYVRNIIYVPDRNF
jgi:hypothetical protein